MAADTNAFNGGGVSERTGRIIIYALLVLVALYYLAPLYVMITTSLKSLDEIRRRSVMMVASKAIAAAG